MTPAPGEGHVLVTPALPEGAAAELHLADLMRLSDPALSELALEALLDEVLIRIREALSVDTVAVLLHDPDTNELVARAAKGLEAEVEAGVRIPLGRGFAGRIAAERRAIAIYDLDHADVVNPILHDMGLCSMLGVPLIVEAELIGVLHVGSMTPREFSSVDAAVLELAAGRVAPSIERARLMDQLHTERLAAEALQRGLLPDIVPPISDIEVAARYVPARASIGGDWYDVVPLDGARIGMAIGDVVGHGVRAAALMSQMRAALRAYALLHGDPAEVLYDLDRYVQHSYPAGMATVAYAVLNTISGELLYASAGHPPALLVGSDGAQLVDVQPSPPIGVQPLPRYASTALELPAGAAILLYTDGLVERRGEPLSVGLQRLCRSALGSPSPEALCTRVLHDLIGPLSSEDDVAMVALRRHSTPQSLDLELPAARTSLALLRRRLSAWLSGNAVGDADRNAIVLAVGEAAANAVEHAYAPGHAVYRVEALVDGEDIVVTITDEGRWRTESRTTHRGRGLTIMRRAMDSVDIDNTDGTRVTLRRNVRRQG